MNAATFVLLASFVLQLTAAFLALRAIRTTGRRAAWTLIAAAIFLMAMRRGVTLFRVWSGDAAHPVDPAAELVALAISALMVAGIAPFLVSYRRSQEQLRETTTMLEAVYDAYPDLQFVLDEDGTILDARGGTGSELGRVARGLVGQRMQELLPPDLARGFEQGWAELRRSGAPYVGEFRLLRPDRGPGERDYYEARMLPLGDGRSVAICRDITARREAERELARHREDLEQMVAERTTQLEGSRVELERSRRLASIGTLAAGIAHEINNPLGVILLEAGRASERRNDPEERDRALQSIRRHVERCARIVKGVLRFARHQKSERWPLDVNDTLRRARDMTREHVRSHGVAVRFFINDPLPAVEANATELEQVWVNLVHNAVRACESGGEVTVTSEAVDGGVRVVVEDTGCGMTPEQIDRAFDPFFTTWPARGGTGLGLSTCHGIVAEHGGQISLASAAPERGTRVAVDFPAASVSEGRWV